MLAACVVKVLRWKSGRMSSSGLDCPSPDWPDNGPSVRPAALLSSCSGLRTFIWTCFYTSLVTVLFVSMFSVWFLFRITVFFLSDHYSALTASFPYSACEEYYCSSPLAYKGNRGQFKRPEISPRPKGMHLATNSSHRFWPPV